LEGKGLAVAVQIFGKLTTHTQTVPGDTHLHNNTGTLTFGTMTKELLRWEDSPGLGKSNSCYDLSGPRLLTTFPEHHCPKCQTPLNNPRAKHTCYFKHVEICPMFHQHFFMIGKSTHPVHDITQCNVILLLP
jgi:hypothetical protein